MSESNITLISTGRYDVPDIVKYVKSMLEHVNLEGAFRLRISRKIKGGPEHHGVCVRYVEHAAVLLTAQSGDNSTRFECYLNSREMKPAAILEQLNAQLKNRRYVYEDDRSKKSPPAPVPQETSADQSPSAAAESPVIQEKPGHLGVYASDETLRNMVISAIEGKFHREAFTTKQLHAIMLELDSHEPTQHAAGQLARRLVNKGVLDRIEDTGVTRLYRLTSAAMTGVYSVSGKPAPVVPELSETDRRIAELRKLASEFEDASRVLVELSREEAGCSAEIESLKAKLVELEDRRSGIIQRQAEYERVTKSEAHKVAMEKIAAIDAIVRK